jgi:anaerobic magnesium-protoporphyrin IX monomethyl ester cyclase
MIGYAGETDQTVKKTINFALELDPDLAMFTVVTPYPATPLYELAKREALIETDYWREFTLGRARDKRIPYFLPDAESWVKKAYRAFYLRPAYMVRRLAKINSFGAFKKSVEAASGILAFDMQGREAG